MPIDGVETAFGLTAIDDAIGFKASPSYASNILETYDEQVASLAAQGAHDGKSRLNWAWVFTPEGTLATSHQKRHMAPPERRD